MKKNQRFKWEEEEQQAFDEIKRKVSKMPVLTLPNPDKPFLLATDASKFASGAVLMQKDLNGDWHPCGFYSQSFSGAERGYEIYDKELLGIIRGLEHWKHLLAGNGFQNVVLTDHNNLTYFRQPQRLNPRQARWLLRLSEFDLTLKHVPGNQMTIPDLLSRRADLSPPGEEENVTTILLPDELFVRGSVLSDIEFPNAIWLRTIDTTLKERILNAPKEEEIVKEAIQNLQKSNLTSLKKEFQDWEIDEGLLFYKGRCYVPTDE